jgi:hypothetical protein
VGVSGSEFEGAQTLLALVVAHKRVRQCCRACPYSLFLGRGRENAASKNMMFGGMNGAVNVGDSCRAVALQFELNEAGTCV